MQFDLKGHAVLELFGFALVRVSDARGRRVPLLRYGTAPNKDARGVMARSVPGTHWGRVALLCACFAAIAYFSRAAVLSILETGTLTASPFALLTIALSGLTLFLLVVDSRSLYGSDAAARLVDAGYCASCGYSIRELPLTSDGCKPCPECSAVWHVHGPAPDPTHTDPRRAGPTRMYRLGRLLSRLRA